MIENAAGLRRILRDYRDIAIVGLSPKWHRPSYFAAKYLVNHGYRIFPVNPAHSEILGRKCYPSLADIPEKVEVADCFRRAEEMPALAKQAAEIGARVFWMQIGAHNDEAAQIAESAGMETVSDRCMKIEHGRLFGGLHFAGVNTGVISPRRRGADS